MLGVAGRVRAGVHNAVDDGHRSGVVASCSATAAAVGDRYSEGG